MKLNAMRLPISSLLIVGVLVAAGCTSGRPTESSPLPPSSVAPAVLDATYRTGPIHFRYPSDWMTKQLSDSTTMSEPMVALSSQTMSDPCTTTGNTTRCTYFPIDSLQPGGVVLEWSAQGFPGRPFGAKPGRVITVDDYPAKISGDDPVCGGYLKADRSLSVVIARPGVPDNWYQLDACFRDPGADAAVAEVMALLKTVRISGR